MTEKEKIMVDKAEEQMGIIEHEGFMVMSKYKLIRLMLLWKLRYEKKGKDNHGR